MRILLRCLPGGTTVTALVALPLLTLLSLLALLALLALLPPCAAQTVSRVSLSSGGVLADWDSAQPALSADSRYVAFVSAAGNLVPGGTPDVNDVFLRDRQTGQTLCVSVATDGTRGNADSDSPSLSANGRYVAFRSYASNLVAADSNSAEDIFLRDTVLNTTTRVSVGSGGSQADGPSVWPGISADGSLVAFASAASSLSPGAPGGVRRIYVRDVQNGLTSCISLAPGGAPANGDSYTPSLSPDGRFVAFASVASNLVPNDGNGVSDVFLADRVAGTVSRISTNSDGNDALGDSDSPAVSADGRFVAFRSFAPGLAAGRESGQGDIYIREVAGSTALVSAAPGGLSPNGGSEAPALSADGRYVVFVSRASNLVTGDANGWEDVFVRDTRTGHTTLVSTGASGNGNYWSLAPAITPNGLFVGFASYATNLVPGSSNAVGQVYVSGPLAVTYSFGDAQRALQIAAGLQGASQLDLARLDVESTGTPARIDLMDAVRIVRRSAGLDP